MNYYNCIYMYTNKINGKRYVGQAKDFNERHKQHIRNHKMIVDKAIDKYGADSFEIKILAHDVPTLDKLNEYEKFFIKRYKSSVKEWGYNVAEGGHNGNVFDGKTEEEMREIGKRMSEGKKGKYLGANSYWYGKAKTEEQKKKIGNTLKKYSGENSWNYGLKRSEETKQKISKNHADFSLSKHPKARKVDQYTKDGEFIKTWDTAQEAELFYGNKNAKIKMNITHCCRGRQKTAYGFIWKYHDEINN